MGVVASYGTVSARVEDKRREYVTDDEDDQQVDRSRVSQMSQSPPRHAGGASYNSSDLSFDSIKEHEDRLTTTSQRNTTERPSNDIQEQDDDAFVVLQMKDGEYW